MRRVELTWAGALLLLAACDIVDPPPMDPALNFVLTVTSGADQVGSPGALLDQPVAVRLFDKIRGTVVVNRPITFRADPGAGLQLESVSPITDASGIAQTKVRLGSVLGRHTIRVDFEGNSEDPLEVVVESAATPVITSVSPQNAASEDQVTIRGQNFGQQPNWNDVRVGSLRATILRASSTELKVLLPRCLSGGTSNVVVRRGSLASAPAALTAAGSTIRPVVLQPGAALQESQSQSCVRVSAQAAATRYLIMPLNVSQEGTGAANFEVFGSSSTPAPTGQRILFDPVAHARDVQLEFEAHLRKADAAIAARVQPRPATRDQALARIAVPQMGDQRRFNVATQWARPETVTGEVRAIGRHIVIYVDREVSGLTGELLQTAVRLFDDVIYDTDVAVYGQPSDIDNNGRAAVLITPAVNRLTPAGSTGYISGFFYSCDLVMALECPDTNSGEILYTLAPDPNGEFGLKHSQEAVLRLLPTTMAHEFMHSIHFNQRVLVGGAGADESLWLMEGLAHSAEDTVAAVLRSRGDTATAKDISYHNNRRASMFLAATSTTSLVPTSGGGSLEERGASWLLLKYLRQRVDPAILGKLARARDAGSRNIVAQSGRPWSGLLRDWATAIYVAATPELNGLAISPTQTFGSFDLRAAVSTVSTGNFPFVPRTSSSADFSIPLNMPASSAAYVVVDVPAGEEFFLTLDGAGGGSSPSGAASLAILRIR